MKLLKIIVLLTVVIITSTDIKAQSSGSSIKVTNITVADVEYTKKDANIVYDVSCRLTNMAGKSLSFVLVPLDENLNVLNDKNGNPRFAEASYLIEQNDGDGVVEVKLPASLLPVNSKQFHVACMVFDTEVEKIWCESEPFVCTTAQLDRIAKDKAIKMGASLFDLLLGSGSSGSGTDSKGKVQCSNCYGSGECPECKGAGGKAWGVTCTRCNNNGKCIECGGTGYVAEKNIFGF